MPALRILCVEDNPFGRVVMNAILVELGHQVDFASSGEAAVEAAARGGVDVVLMDVTLAGIDGFEATRRIRALPGAAGQVPVIGISARSEPGAADAAPRRRHAGLPDEAGEPAWARGDAATVRQASPYVGAPRRDDSSPCWRHRSIPSREQTL